MSSINLAWNQNSTYDSFNIYRSMTTMDINSLPAPIATGVTAKSFIDDTIEDNETYFYRIGVLRDSELMISDEIQVNAF